MTLLLLGLCSCFGSDLCGPTASCTSARVELGAGVLANLIEPVASGNVATISTTPFSAESGETWSVRGKTILRLVRENFYQPEQAAQWAAAHESYVLGTTSAEDFSRRTRAALAALKTSHTAYYPRDEPESYHLAAIFQQSLKLEPRLMPSIGADIRADGFLRHVFVGGPADRAGLKRGDRIVSVDGKPLHPIHSFEKPSGSNSLLMVQRAADAQPFAVKVVPRMVNPKEEWLEAQEKSARVYKVGAKQVAYMHLFSGAGVEHLDVLRDAVTGVFAEADALVLDLRDGWGGCNPDFVNLFSQLPPVLEQVDRQGKRTAYDPQWRKPVVILVNSRVRSGKEVLARTVQRRGLGKIIGETTAGAVVAGRPFLLEDQSILFLAVADVRVDGERLEGVGVVPDIKVIDDLPFANGVDPPLERALDEAIR